MRAHITKKTIWSLQGGSLGCSRGPPLWILLSSLLHRGTFEVTLPLSVCPKGFSGSLFAQFGPQFAAPGVAFLAYLSETILYCGTSCRAGSSAYAGRSAGRVHGGVWGAEPPQCIGLQCWDWKRLEWRICNLLDFLDSRIIFDVKRHCVI